MIDFEQGDDLPLIVEAARAFAVEQLLPNLREHEHARSVGDAIRRSYDEMDLASLELPETLGGAGLGALARVLVNEELGAADPGAALSLDRLGTALYPLLELGGEDALREHALPVLHAGGRLLLVDTREADLEVSRVVSGEVPWVPAERADAIVVQSDSGVCVLREGFTLSPLRGAGLRAAGAASLSIQNAPLAARWDDAAAVARSRARVRLYTAALLLGVLRRAAEFSRGYALERQAFGRPIAHHQALAFLIVDMHAAVEGARALLHEAAWRVDRGRGGETAAAAAAYAEAIEASLLVGPNAVQILGGHGFMQDYPVEKSMREARVLGLLHGGIDAAREDAGRDLLAGPGESLALPRSEAPGA